MSKPTVAEWRAFLSELPKGRYLDELEVVVGNEPLDMDVDCDPTYLEALDQAAPVKVDGLIRDENDKSFVQDVSQAFGVWRRRRRVATLVVEVARANEDKLRAAVVAAGGRIVR